MKLLVRKKLVRKIYYLLLFNKDHVLKVYKKITKILYL